MVLQSNCTDIFDLKKRGPKKKKRIKLIVRLKLCVTIFRYRHKISMFSGIRCFLATYEKDDINYSKFFPDRYFGQ